MSLHILWIVGALFAAYAFVRLAQADGVLPKSAAKVFKFGQIAIFSITVLGFVAWAAFAVAACVSSHL